MYQSFPLQLMVFVSSWKKSFPSLCWWHPGHWVAPGKQASIVWMHKANCPGKKKKIPFLRLWRYSIFFLKSTTGLPFTPRTLTQWWGWVSWWEVPVQFPFFPNDYSKFIESLNFLSDQPQHFLHSNVYISLGVYY